MRERERERESCKSRRSFSFCEKSKKQIGTARRRQSRSDDLSKINYPLGLGSGRKVQLCCIQWSVARSLVRYNRVREGKREKRGKRRRKERETTTSFAAAATKNRLRLRIFCRRGQGPSTTGYLSLLTFPFRFLRLLPFHGYVKNPLDNQQYLLIIEQFRLLN